MITIPHTNSNIYSVVRVRVRVTWPEGPWQWLTSPEAALTGNDCVRMQNRFPCFFLTILIVQNVPLRITDMATGCDLTPKGFPCKSARMHNQKLRNIRPSGDFWLRKWRHVTKMSRVKWLKWYIWRFPSTKCVFNLYFYTLNAKKNK